MRYPVQDLLAATGWTEDEARQRLSIPGGTFAARKRWGFTFDQAERYAERAGLNLLSVWPEAVAELVDRESRVCAAEGCDERFVPSNPRRIYCSNLCRDRRHKARWARDRYRSDAGYREAQIERTARYHREVVVPARERRRARTSA